MSCDYLINVQGAPSQGEAERGQSRAGQGRAGQGRGRAGQGQGGAHQRRLLHRPRIGHRLIHKRISISSE